MTCKEEREKKYLQTRDELLHRQLSNSENYDRAILTLSTTCLGLSLIFIRNIVPFEIARFKILLAISWLFFAFAIVSTLFSFFTSQLGINKQLFYAEKYYLDRKAEYLNKKNIPAKITICLNTFSGVAFIIAIFTTIIFVLGNIIGG